MRTLILLLSSVLTACATPNGGDAFDSTFDPSWMRVIPIDARTMPYFCQRPDKQSLDGCVKRFNDVGYTGVGAKGRGTCAIYISSVWPEGSAGYNELLAHEVRHCRGWRHVGD